ncbi:adenosine deaminase [Penicillium alfredii]|uniref:Adenosine deaminase n=1 Tax=Penicillium alfredii TaxID=1506179 RepID=A0A9W9F1K4_9EURO|nr:adenosine deaminase [Penicillium alfredii]KAJ5091973.1 adenosine deaminase [Penicillium alfredii]
MNGHSITPFIASLPKVELHIHIEGTLQPALRWKLAQRNNVPLKVRDKVYRTYEELLDSYKVIYNHRPELGGRKDVPSFLEAYFAGCEVLLKEDDFYDLAMDYLSRCRAMNVRYAEPFFDIQAHTRRGVAADAVLNGYLRAQKDGAEKYGVRSNWIFCFLRDEPVDEGEAAYDAALPWAAVKGGKGLFHAVGLASNAYERPILLFKNAFERARRDGLHTTTHCDFGQKDTHEHIRQAIFEVGVERIDHGLDVLDREELVAGLKKRNVGLTLCPHAYHRRTATEVLFPKLRQLLDRGVQYCINSDDPVYMHDVWVDGNMEKAYYYGGLSKAEMVQLSRNAVDMCWADDEVKKGIYAELDAVDVD